ALERLQEDGLRDVFRLGGTAEEADRGGEHHVLELPHEVVKRVGVSHAWDVAHRPSWEDKHRRRREVSTCSFWGALPPQTPRRAHSRGPEAPLRSRGRLARLGALWWLAASRPPPAACVLAQC